MVEAREYQKEIFENAKDKNTLVVLPTGLGKTLIALMLTKDRLEKFPRSKILIMAPTRPLIEQHYYTFQKTLGDLYAEYVLITGKIKSEDRIKKMWTATIIFSTPQCIANDLKRGVISLEDFSLLVFDEAHRAVKDYSYVYVSNKYKMQGINKRVLALTASPGHEEEKIKKICETLDIEHIEIRNRESKDVKEYIQEMKLDIVRVDMPPEFELIKDKIKEIYAKKIEELQNRKILFDRPTKTNLLELQKRIFNAVNSGNKNFNLLKGLSLCVQAIKLQYALELLETQGITPFYLYLQKLLKESEEGRKASLAITKTEIFKSVYLVTAKLKAENFEHPKQEKLIEVLNEILGEKNKKIIVFTQYRDTVNKIKERLNQNKINAEIFVGQAKRRNIGMSQKEQKIILDKFKENKINVLISTSIGEEGLDIPEVDAVIFYEPIPSAIRQIQRRGRTARLKPGKVIVLMTRSTRDEVYYYASKAKERKMNTAIESLKQKFTKKQQSNLNDF